jgi:hypothetical protein
MLKYASICVPIGEDGHRGVTEYLDVAKKSAFTFFQEEKEVDWADQTFHLVLVALLIKKASVGYPHMQWQLSWRRSWAMRLRQHFR